jgi:AraC-like DNA-binding protein
MAELRSTSAGSGLDHRPSSEGSPGLDGVAVESLLRGAVMKGHDPFRIMDKASIDASVYGDPDAAIDGRALFRLMEQIQVALDDAYIGFLSEPCRMALEMERSRAYLHCATLGEALRVSIRFTQALSADIGPQLIDEDPVGPKHVCSYRTIPGVDRDIFVWLRFVWIYHLFSWLIGRPLNLLGVSVRGSRPVQASGFDRFALFGCPIQYGAPVDALCYDRRDLNVQLVHRTLAEYEDYNASGPDWFAPPSGGLTCRMRTERVLIEMQRAGRWSAPIESVAEQLRSQPRRLRRDLLRENECFQQIRTRLRGELAGAYLLATDMPVTAVGYKVGFSEPSSFTRNFSAWAGMTPSEYRARYRPDRGRIAAATTLLTERCSS